MITSKQRSYLRKLANQLDPIIQIGKGGISQSMATSVQQALESREIIKIHVLNNSDFDTRDACHQLAEMVEAEEVQVVGNKFVLYKKSKENPTIQLP